ncbi:MAG: PhoH family protein [Alphaproteobacteria bacterium]|jgi:phosphate starvation-inducible PhoH-like protein|nr:PhoH family protein [Alphaproteobacteria bacterium]
MTKTPPLTAAVAFPDVAVAQAVCGPLNRHLALIEENFRDRGGPRGKPTYAVRLELKGDQVELEARPGHEKELRWALCALESLAAHAKDRRKVRESDVQSALAFCSLDPDRAAGPLTLPQVGGLTIRTPRQLHYVEAMQEEACDLVFGVGPAGTGKTFLAVACAVEALKAERFERIVVTRPAVEAGERLGFLPGAMEEKVDPYLQPIWDAFRGQLGEVDLRNRRDRRQVEVAPLAFMRGRTLANAFVIVDEAQNATIPQMKMVLTRLGEGSRMVVTGDPSQIDLPRATPSGLAHALRLLEGVTGVEVIRFAAQDVVRHRLVARIIEAYDRDEARARAASVEDQQDV